MTVLNENQTKVAVPSGRNPQRVSGGSGLRTFTRAVRQSGRFTDRNRREIRC
jgi:hypothetical protein